MRIKQRIVVTFVILLGVFVNAQTVSETTALYAQVKPNIYQIQVINKATGKKVSIGSGFVVGKGNILATNYHVIANYVEYPDEYELIYLSTNDKKGKLSLLSVNVIRDLAMVSSTDSLGVPFVLADIPLQGSEIFALGNPHDLGFIIVSGINNGLLRKSDYKNILFSGSLNSGMSGGPTVNKQGQVIGVNVATRGNDISFVIPAAPLLEMVDHLASSNYQVDADLKQSIATQLVNDSKAYFQTFRKNEWQFTELGGFSIPLEVNPNFECWDASIRDAKLLLSVKQISCRNKKNIYLNQTTRVGSIGYRYSYLDASKNDLLASRFYQYYQRYYRVGTNKDKKKEKVSEYSCYTDFTQIAEHEFKTTVCQREYLDFSGMSDISMTSVLIGEKQAGFVFKMTMNGAGLDEALTLYQSVLQEIKWNN